MVGLIKVAHDLENTMSYENLIKWTYKHTKLHEHFVKNKNQITSWKINCGQIYTCYFGENIAAEKSKIEARPCVIVSANRINHNSSNVIVVPLSKTIKWDTNQPGRLKYPHHYVLYKSNYPLLNYDSAVQCEDIRCVSKVRLCTYICNTTSKDLKGIQKCIKSALQL